MQKDFKQRICTYGLQLLVQFRTQIMRRALLSTDICNAELEQRICTMEYELMTQPSSSADYFFVQKLANHSFQALQDRIHT